MLKVTVSVAGLVETKAALDKLSRATGKRVMREALRAGGEITARLARSMAPVDTGGLRESVDVSGVLSNRQAAMHVRKSEVEMFIGPSGSAKSIVQEFGSIDQAPQPYLRPAWDSTKNQVLDRVADEVMVNVDKATIRAAKRAANKAGK